MNRPRWFKYAYALLGSYQLAVFFNAKDLGPTAKFFFLVSGVLGLGRGLWLLLTEPVRR